METLTVIKYIEEENYSVCKDKQGNRRRIDLISSGCLPDNTDPKTLVGKTIKIDYTHAYIELAEGVEIIDT